MPSVGAAAAGGSARVPSCVGAVRVEGGGGGGVGGVGGVDTGPGAEGGDDLGAERRSARRCSWSSRRTSRASALRSTSGSLGLSRASSPPARADFPLPPVARVIRRLERMGRLLTSIPAMTAKPRTTMWGEPGTIGTSRIFRLRPPMKEKPRSSTSKPSGTMTLIPPQKAKAVISTSGPSISARLRSRSQPPMMATALVRIPMRQRPRVEWPLMTATCQRLALCVETTWAWAVPAAGSGTTGRSAMTASSSPRVLASRAAPIRSENSSRVRRPATTCSRSMVTVRSRSASATRMDSSEPGSGTGWGWGWGWGSGSIRSAIETVLSDRDPRRSDGPPPR